MINTTATMKVKGSYSIIKLNSAGEILEELNFDNIITDIGLDRISFIGSSAAQWIAGCRLGTGSTTPTNLDSSMAGSYIRSDIVQSTSRIVSDTGTTYERVHVFPLNAVTTPTNYYEIGMDWDTAESGVLFSRALIRNSSGIPTVLSLQPNEILVVTYRIFFAYPVMDPIELSGYNISICPMAVPSGNTTTSTYSIVAESVSPYRFLPMRVYSTKYSIATIRSMRDTGFSTTGITSPTSGLTYSATRVSTGVTRVVYTVSTPYTSAAVQLQGLILGAPSGFKCAVIFEKADTPGFGIPKLQGQSNLVIAITFSIIGA